MARLAIQTFGIATPTVTLTKDSDGSAIQLYSDAALTQTVAQPATPTGTQNYYFTPPATSITAKLLSAGVPVNTDSAVWLAEEQRTVTPYLPVPAVAATAATASVLEGVGLQARGHSYLPQPPVYAQAGGDAQTRLGRRLNLGTVSTYAVGSSRMFELFQDAIDTTASTASPIAGSTAGVGLRGVCLVDGFANDIFGWNGSVYAPASPTAQRLLNAQNALTGILALLSCSQRVEVESGTATGTWTNSTALQGYSGKTLNFTSVQNAKYDVPVTFTSAGKAWFVSYALSTGAIGAFTVAVDGVVQYTNPGGTLADQIVSKRGTGTTYTSAPILIPLTATAGAHTVTITKTDAAATLVYADVILVQSATPPLIIVSDDPLPVAGASSPFLTAQNITDITAAKAAWTTALTNAVSNFSNAYRLDLSPLSSLTYLSSLDGVHPNDRGMRLYCDMLVAQANSLVTAYSQGVHRL